MNNPGMLSRAVERVAAEARHDCLVCLVSDGFGLDEATRRHVTRLTEHNDVIGVFVYDPMEKQMPEAGRLVFSDGEKQIDFDTGNRRLREAFSVDFGQRMKQMRETSRRHDIPLLPVHTGTPVDVQVRDLLGRRGGNA